MNFSDINIICFVNLSIIDSTQFVFFLILDNSSTKFIVIVWNKTKNECIDCKFSYDLWRRVWIAKHCEQCLMYWQSALINSLIYQKRMIISKQTSNLEWSCSWAVVNMFNTQIDKMHIRCEMIRGSNQISRVGSGVIPVSVWFFKILKSHSNRFESERIYIYIECFYI
jgi:hypothetical protein